MKMVTGAFTLFLMSLQVFAITESSLLQNLERRIHSLPESKGALIKSFTHNEQSYIYDQALAIIAFSHAKDKKNAERLIEGMAQLQNADGSLYFSYYLNGLSPYPQEGDKRFAGAISWVALSLGHYQEAFESTKYQDFKNKLFTYLKNEVKTFEFQGEKVQAIRFNPTNIVSSKWNEAETLALEHNLDLYAAFIYDQKLNGTNWSSEISGMKKFITGMWDKQLKHFWSGADLKTGNINKDEIYLDNQTWSLLALDPSLLNELNMSSALAMNCEMMMGEHEGVIGFSDRKPVRGQDIDHFVWSEGSLGQIMAMQKHEKLIQNEFVCEGKTSQELLSSLKKMKKEDGGLAYSTPTSNPDFTNASSVAGTAWMYFAQVRYNPFSPNEG